MFGGTGVCMNEEFKVGDKKMNTKTGKIDWNIHAVYQDKDHLEPIDIHTHGLEKYGIYNICMKCPTQDLISFCGEFINYLAQTMIDGEKYNVNQPHLIDDVNNNFDVLHMFYLTTDERDNGNGKEKVYIIDYWFDRPVISPYNFSTYVFDKLNKIWKKLKVDYAPNDECYYTINVFDKFSKTRKKLKAVKADYDYTSKNEYYDTMLEVELDTTELEDI